MVQIINRWFLFSTAIWKSRWGTWAIASFSTFLSQSWQEHQNGLRISLVGSSWKWLKNTRYNLWPRVERNTASFLKIQRKIWCMHVLGVCLCMREKRNCVFYVEALERLLLHPFVDARICLHLWNACVFLWQRPRSLVLLFVRAPAFNSSGLCHINKRERREELSCCSLYTGWAITQSVKNEKKESKWDNKGNPATEGGKKGK